MKKILDVNKLIEEYSDNQRGVFSLGDLKNIIDGNNSLIYRIIDKLSEAGILNQFCRGFYITEKFDLKTLNQRICSESYISFGNILADNLLIGSVPNYRVMSVKLGKSRIYNDSKYTVDQRGIKKELFFGYKIENGIKIATAEKAFLDVIYFYQKGMKFSFDIYNDIDIEGLDKNLVLKYLKKYKNKIFITLVKELLNGN